MKTKRSTLILALEHLAPLWDGVALCRLRVTCKETGALVHERIMFAPIEYARYLN